MIFTLFLRSNHYRQKMYIDTLTHVENRAKFVVDFESLYRDSIMRNKLLGMILIDIDYFKNINDTYGHDIGDKVLIEFSSRLSSIIRRGDHLYRWGGEEFNSCRASYTANGNQYCRENSKNNC